MTLADIKRIERETGFALPQCYVDVVTKYPIELKDSDAPDYGLLDSPDPIIEENNSVRKNGYFGEEWPGDYFIVGHNGCGDYYVITLNSNKFSIGFADHEIMACNLYSNDLEEFIQKYVSEQ